MKKLAVVLIVLAGLCIACPVFGCTGFAVYGETPIYGMNFDYPPTELKWVAWREDDTGVFAMFLQTEDGGFLPTVGMNDQGLFSSVQMQYPQEAGRRSRGENDLYISELLDCLNDYGSVDDVLGMLDGKRLIQWPDITLHTLLADAAGNALIAEAGETHNEIIPMTGDFIVMTNFKNADFRDQPYDRVTGVGADRYKTASHYIREQDGFGIDQAFETLRLTTQGGSYPTLCSMVFAPEEQSVYVALSRDFDHIWKVSIADSTIETYWGFDEDLKFYIPEDGVTASDLMAGDFAAYKVYTGPEEASAVTGDTDAGAEEADSTGSPIPGWYWAAGILLTLAVVVMIGILVRKRRDPS